MGVSDKSAQNNNHSKGNKKDLKKPLQVLHINKKDTLKKSQEIDNEKIDSPANIKNENVAIKPQIIKNKSTLEIQNNEEILETFDSSIEALNKPLKFSDKNTEFQLERD